MNYEEWLHTMADDYILELPEQYRRDQYEDFLTMLDDSMGDYPYIGYLDDEDIAMVRNSKGSL